MLFVCYPNCSTCKKARAFLESRNATFTVRDIKTDRPTEEELRLWQAQSGLPLKKFFNTSGQQYRALGLQPGLGFFAGGALGVADENHSFLPFSSGAHSAQVLASSFSKKAARGRGSRCWS